MSVTLWLWVTEWEHVYVVGDWWWQLADSKNRKEKIPQLLVDFRLWTPMESGAITRWRRNQLVHCEEKKNQQDWRFTTFFTEQFCRHYNYLLKTARIWLRLTALTRTKFSGTSKQEKVTDHARKQTIYRVKIRIERSVRHWWSRVTSPLDVYYNVLWVTSLLCDLTLELYAVWSTSKTRWEADNVACCFYLYGLWYLFIVILLSFLVYRKLSQSLLAADR